MKNSGFKKIAERYVTALFAVATAENSIADVEKDLAALAALLAESSDFRAFLHNPLLNRNAQVEIAGVVLKTLGVHDITQKFIALLANHKRLELLAEVIQLFLEKAMISRGELAAELVSAAVLSDAQAAPIADKLSKAYNKKITLKLRADASLLGGAIINIGSTQLDGSLAGKLNRLQLSLKAA